MPEVTVIISAYNTEKYIAECLESAITQTFEDIEIICVNDGSTDHTLDIMEEYARKDSRIRIISKDNTGYGHSMNIGIDQASGRYVVFLESDDYILPTMCERMYQVCEQHELEIVKCDFYRFFSRADRVCKRYYRASYHASYDDCYGKIFSAREDARVFLTPMYTWTCMYRRDYLNKYNIRHNETPGASYQDNGFWFQSLMYCQRIYLLNEAFYMYRQDNPVSSMHSRDKVHAFSDEYAFIREKIADYVGDRGKLLKICAYFNLHHNFNSLLRVDEDYIMELIELIVKDLRSYGGIEYFDINSIDMDQSRRILQCIVQPEKVRKNAIGFRERYRDQLEFLQRYPAYILYGAGEYAEYIFRILMEEFKLWDREVYCGVTEPQREQEFGGMKVENIETLCKIHKNALVIVCASKKKENNNQQMHDLLEKIGCDQFIDGEHFIWILWDIFGIWKLK